MFLLQAILFWLMPHVTGFGLFTTLAFVILLCYGGGFGTTPAFAADYFGPANVGSIYGLMLTAWGFAGLFGPMLIARVRQSSGHYSQALNVIAVLMLVSAILPLITRPPKAETVQEEELPRPRAA
jgi:OFA family oxalate/formate antiporter-like MFS transporter